MKAAAHGHLSMQHAASLSCKAGLLQEQHLQHQLQGRAGHSGIQISSARWVMGVRAESVTRSGARPDHLMPTRASRRAHKQGSSSSLLQAAGSLASSMSDLSSLQLGAGNTKFVRAAAKYGGGGGALASSPSKRQLPVQAYVSPYSQRR